MWNTPQGKVYLATGHVDFRKSINGLALLVAETLELDPVSTNWFVFCSRGRDKLKIFAVGYQWLLAALPAPGAGQVPLAPGCKRPAMPGSHGA